MMRSAFWRACALTIAVALVFPVLILQNAEAAPTETAHSAMSGSLLIPTTSEFDAFPYKALGRRLLVEGTTGMSDPFAGGDINDDHGRVKLVTGIGDDWALQFQANNQAFGARLAEYAWHGSVSYRPFMIDFTNMGDLGPNRGVIDLLEYRGGESNKDAFENSRFDVDLIGRAGDGGWSLGVFQGNQSERKQETVEAPGGPTVPKEYDTNSVFGARGAFGTGNGLDLAGEIAFETYNLEQQTTGSETQKEDGSTFTISGFGKFRLGPAEQDWNLLAAAHLAFGNSKIDEDDDPATPLVEEKHQLLAFMLGAGKLLQNDEDGQVSAELYVDLMTGKQDQETGENDEDKVTSIALPGTALGFWHHIGGPFRIMGGAAANFRLKAFKRDVDDTSTTPPGTRTDDERNIGELEFRYTIGVGLDLADDKVAIDLQLHPEGIPKLVSFGNADNTIMVASVQVDLP